MECMAISYRGNFMKLCIQEREAMVDALMHDTHPLRMKNLAHWLLEVLQQTDVSTQLFLRDAFIRENFLVQGHTFFLEQTACSD